MTCRTCRRHPATSPGGRCNECATRSFPRVLTGGVWVRQENGVKVWKEAVR